MRKIFFAILIMITGAAMFASAATASDGEWKLVMDKNGIKAYSRPVEGSGIFEFRAVAVVDAPLEVVGEMLRDVPSTSEWLPYCDKSQMAEMKDRNHFTTYLSLDVPWPLKNRDLVLKTSTEYDLEHGRAVTDLINTTLASYPEKDTHIRMPCLTGQYVFEFVTRERTGIVHTYRADLAGSVPEWMANFATKYNMYNTFQNMKEMFKKEKYIELGAKSPDRKVVEDALANKENVKQVMISRLTQFINDAEFLEMLTADKGIDEVLFTDNGKTSEILLYGWGSDDSKKDAIRGILKAYLASVTQDESLINNIIGDAELLDVILNAPGDGGTPSKVIIENHLKKGDMLAQQN